MADIQQSSFANVQAPVFNPIPVLNATRPPDMRGLIQPVPWASLIGGGLQTGLQAGQEFAKLPLMGQQIAAERQRLNTEGMVQQAAQKNLQSNQQWNPQTISYGPGGETTKSPVPVMPGMAANAMGFGVPGNPAAGMNEGDSTANAAATPPTPPPAVPQTDAHGQPVPPPGPSINSGHVAPFGTDEVLNWYKQNKGTNAQDAVWNSGTGRYDVSLKGGAVQPVHPDFIRANMGQWRPAAADPTQAVDPNMASSPGQPPPPPVINPVAAHSQMQQQSPSLNINDPAMMSAAFQRIQQQHPPIGGQDMDVSPEGSQNYGEPDPNRIEKATGLTHNQIGLLAGNPNAPPPGATLVRDDPTAQSFGDIAFRGPNGTAYIDHSNGMPYVGVNSDYTQHRFYLGQQQPVDVDMPGSLANKKIDELIAAQGFGDASKMNPTQREAAYRSASAQANSKPAPPEFGDKLRGLDQLTQLGQSLQGQLSKLSPEDRNRVNQGLNEWKNEYGNVPAARPILAGMDKLFGTGQGSSQPSPALVSLKNTYTEMQNLVRDTEFGKRFTPAEIKLIKGQLGDPSQVLFPQSLNDYTNRRGAELSRMIDYGLASHYQLPASIVQRSNNFHYGTAPVPQQQQQATPATKGVIPKWGTKNLQRGQQFIAPDGSTRTYQ